MANPNKECTYNSNHQYANRMIVIRHQFTLLHLNNTFKHKHRIDRKWKLNI